MEENLKELIEKIQGFKTEEEFETLTDEEIDMLVESGVLDIDDLEEECDCECECSCKSNSYIEVDKNEIIDSFEFEEGLQEGLFYAGFVTALKNAGLEFSDAIQILDLHINKTLVKENNETTLKVSKVQELNGIKNTI